LDRSGSMHNLNSENIIELNRYLEELKGLDRKCRVTLATFATTVTKVLDQVKLEYIEPIDQHAWTTSGTTSLNDAIGSSIAEAKRDRDTIMMIMTDGGENSSSEFTGEAVRELIKLKEGQGWEFIFFGAGVDAMAAGGHLGLRANQYVNLSADAQGMQDRTFTMMSSTRTYSEKSSEIS